MVNRVIKAALYNDGGELEDSDSIVVQLQSLLKFDKFAGYDAVILDEICSILSYFQVDNTGMFTAADGRKSMLPFLLGIQRRCVGATYVIVADADIDTQAMDTIDRLNADFAVVQQERDAAVVEARRLTVAFNHSGNTIALVVGLCSGHFLY